MPRSAALALVACALLGSWTVGLFARTLWTPDEPREADIAWRMSWQAQQSVPQLAGENFCEKPPLTYWLAAVPIRLFGFSVPSIRAPNLLYAILTSAAVALLALRLMGASAALIAGTAVGSFMLGYQTLIWFATDAPALAFASVALLGVAYGFYAEDSRARLAGYALMHAGLALAFMSKSLLACLVPLTCLAALIAWERRWTELRRPSLYAGLVISVAIVLPWLAAVYSLPQGPALLKVFLWNNLVGRVTAIDAPAALSYASSHRNYPGKYLVELPLTLWPWTLCAAAAVRAAWQRRDRSAADSRAVRFATCAIVPALAFLSLAGTARNVYAAPLLPGFALLVGWWASRDSDRIDRWDMNALRGTAVMIAVAAVAVLAAIAWAGRDPRGSGLTWDVAGAAVGVALTVAVSWQAARAASSRQVVVSLWCCVLAIGIAGTAPVGMLYREVNRWQDLPSLGASIERLTRDHDLWLLNPDETTRAFVDLYVTPNARVITDPAATDPLTPATRLLVRSAAAQDPQLAGWERVAAIGLPHGRRYTLFAKEPKQAQAPSRTSR